MKKKYNESAEDYLETILMLSKTLPVVRAVDIATELDFKKSSVSVAMKNLREKGHITVTDAGYIKRVPLNAYKAQKRGGYIYLTDSGKKIAEMVYERHDVLMHYLISLGVAEKTAEEDACKIEHIISEESFQAIKNTFTQK